MGDVEHYLGFGLGLLTLVALTVGLARWAGVGLGLFPFWAMVRAVVQLTVVALLLRGILAVPWTLALFLVLMLSTASWTSARRLGQLWRGRRAAVLGVLAGAGITLLAVFALQLVELEVRYLVAVAGIVIGNAMSAATLSGRNFLRGRRRAVTRSRPGFRSGRPRHEPTRRSAERQSASPCSRRWTRRSPPAWSPSPGLSSAPSSEAPAPRRPLSSSWSCSPASRWR